MKTIAAVGRLESGVGRLCAGRVASCSVSVIKWRAPWFNEHFCVGAWTVTVFSYMVRKCWCLVGLEIASHLQRAVFSVHFLIYAFGVRSPNCDTAKILRGVRAVRVLSC